MSKSEPILGREAIAARARLLWEEAGHPTGRDEEFWLRAEQQLLAEMGALVSRSAPPPPAPPAHIVPSPLREVVQPLARPARPKPNKKRGVR